MKVLVTGASGPWLSARMQRGAWRVSRASWLTVLMVVCAGCVAHAPAPTDADARFLRERGIECWLATKKQPRPLRIHHVCVDLSHPTVELAAVLAADPDGGGPATAALEPPTAMADRAKAIVAVNANPWQSLPNESGKRSTNWREGMHVEILGMAVSGGRAHTAPADDHCGFWTDVRGAAHVGNPPDTSGVREAVAGFGRLVQDGKVVAPEGGPIHPRTALGLDTSGRRLYLVVVDGRQPGYSEGMRNDELAAYMRDLGCRDAMNLDGGGSSVMIVRQRDGKLRVMNSPCHRQDGVAALRPIPVALAVRTR